MEDSPMESAAPVVRRVLPFIAAVAIGGGGLVYAAHEHHAAQNLSVQNQQVSAALQAEHVQLNELAAEINALAARSKSRSERIAAPAPVVVRHRVLKPRAGKSRARLLQEQRLNQMQAQLDSQGKEIEATRGDLSNARTELTGSIARTHDELVVLERRGERNYYEFDLDKSKQFQHEGPIGISLRKANVKHQYADLQLMVDDHTVSQKHVNLYQPVLFYASDSEQPIQIVINDISKDQIHGYVSAPKYRRSELTSMAQAADPSDADDVGNSKVLIPPRKRLTLPQ